MDESHSRPAQPERGFMKLFAIFRKSGILVAALTLTVCLAEARAAVAPGYPADPAAGDYSVAALFNQANAHARSGLTGQAILDYERALILAPNDAGSAANLHFMRAKAGVPDPTEGWFTRELTSIPPNTMAWLGCCGLALAGSFILLGEIYPNRRRAIRLTIIAGSLMLAASIGSAIATWPKIHEAVVIVHEAPALTSPVTAAEAVFTLREGDVVTVRAERGNFALVQTRSGRSGWVTCADFARIIPLPEAHAIASRKA
jgi:hypothetical protein